MTKKRRERASIAGLASGAKRSRDARSKSLSIVAAYVFLTGGTQSKSDNKRARDFLKENGAVLDEKTKPTQILADCARLSVRRIEQIIKEHRDDPISKCYWADREEIRQIATVSSRFKKARELNELSLPVAASRLGVSPATLRKHEDGKCDHVPLSLIRQASEVYAMPTDYFFGILRESDDQTEEEAREALFTNRIERMNDSTLAAVNEKYRKMIIVLDEMQLLVREVAKIKKAGVRVLELNPGVDLNLKGGGNLVASIDNALAVAGRSLVRLVRAKLLPIDVLKDFK